MNEYRCCRACGKWAAPLLLLSLAFGGRGAGVAQEIAPGAAGAGAQICRPDQQGPALRGHPRPDGAQTSNLFVPQNPTRHRQDRRRDRQDPRDLQGQAATISSTRSPASTPASFTPDEMQQIVDFYSSPAGQKLASNAADINDAAAEGHAGLHLQPRHRVRDQGARRAEGRGRHAQLAASCITLIAEAPPCAGPFFCVTPADERSTMI